MPSCTCAPESFICVSVLILMILYLAILIIALEASLVICLMRKKWEGFLCAVVVIALREPGGYFSGDLYFWHQCYCN